MAAAKKRWVAYILECADGTLYSGITVDVTRRVEEHNGVGKLGARYTRARRPVELVYAERFPDRSSASKREAALKKCTHTEKRALIAKRA